MEACQTAPSDSPVAVSVFDLTDSPDQPARLPFTQPRWSDVAAPQAAAEPDQVYTFWDQEFLVSPHREAYCHLLNCCQTDLLLLDRGHYWLSLDTDAYCFGTFDLTDVFSRLNRTTQSPAFTLIDLITVCDNVCGTVCEDCSMQALERIDGQYQYRYMYVKCVVEQCMEEAEAEASPPEAVEAELPSDFTWAMSLGVDADKADMYKAAGILELASRQLAQGTNSGSLTVVRELQLIFDQMNALIGWATSPDASVPAPSAPRRPMNQSFTSRKPVDPTRKQGPLPAPMCSNPPKTLEGEFADRKTAVTMCKLHNTKGGKQVMLNKKKSNGTRALLQCATCLEGGTLKTCGDNELQCPYLVNIHKRKTRGSDGAHHWVFGDGKNNVYEHRNCGGSAKATTNELRMFKTSHSAVGANRGVKGIMHVPTLTSANN